MQATVQIDEELLNQAQLLTGITDCSQLIHVGLTTLVQRESARRLAQLGGTEPNLKAPSRRRSTQDQGS